jgi:uncharacterized protein
MRINVLAELRQPVGTVTSSEFEESSAHFDGIKATEINGEARMIRTNAGFLVSVEGTGIASEVCSRCVKDVRCPIEFRFQEEFVALVDPNTGSRVAFQAEPDAFIISKNFVLDLGEGIRQYLLMSEPSKPLCRAECAGLCSTCGADLNVGPCNCAEAGDDRRQVLAHKQLAQPRGGK